MLLKKIQRGLYKVVDDQNNNYRVEDSTRSYVEFQRPKEGELNQYRWGIWEYNEDGWIYLDSNETLKDCLVVIETWATASQLGK